MSMTFSVRVVDEDGDPREGIEVHASFGIMHGGLVEHTDSDGWANFEPSGEYVTVKLFVDGESYGEHPLEDGDTFSFTV